MRDPDARVRGGATWVFGDLDARRMGRVEPGQQPPWSGPERAVVLGRLESLLTDPDERVHLNAAHVQRTVVSPAPGNGGFRRPAKA